MTVPVHREGWQQLQHVEDQQQVNALRHCVGANLCFWHYRGCAATRHQHGNTRYRPGGGGAVVCTDMLDKLCIYLDCRLELQEEAPGSTFRRLIR